MGSIAQLIAACFSQVAQFLRISRSETQRIEILDRKLAVAMARNVDRLDALKHSIRHHEAEVLRKKKEYDDARGDSKRIIGGEIESLFRHLDGLQGQEKILFSNIERINVAQAKLAEYRNAAEKGLEEDEFDAIAVDIEEAFDGLKTADRASRDLNRIQYQIPQSGSSHVERRVAEVTGERETTAGLSPESERRLKQLETEEA